MFLRDIRPLRERDHGEPRALVPAPARRCRWSRWRTTTVKYRVLAMGPRRNVRECVCAHSHIRTRSSARLPPKISPAASDARQTSHAGGGPRLKRRRRRVYACKTAGPPNTAPGLPKVVRSATSGWQSRAEQSRAEHRRSFSLAFAIPRGLSSLLSHSRGQPRVGEWISAVAGAGRTQLLRARGSIDRRRAPSTSQRCSCAHSESASGASAGGRSSSSRV